MPLLNTAKGGKLGTVPVKAVYWGTHLILREITNNATNPSFRANVAGVSNYDSSKSSITWGSTAGYDVPGGLILTQTATGVTGVIIATTQTVSTGSIINASIKCKAPTGIVMTLAARTSGGASQNAVTLTGNGGWQTISVQSTATGAGQLVGVHLTINAAVSTVVNLDQVMLTVGTAAYAGSYTDGNIAGWYWTGTADASTSSGWA